MLAVAKQCSRKSVMVFIQWITMRLCIAFAVSSETAHARSKSIEGQVGSLLMRKEVRHVLVDAQARTQASTDVISDAMKRPRRRGQEASKTTLSCAHGKLEVHDVSTDHGDICRVPGSTWECPVGCEFTSGKRAPYCLWAGTKEECHETTKPLTYTQQEIDAEDALGTSISDGYWTCESLLNWRSTPVCTEPTEEHYDWAQKCPAHCARLRGGTLEAPAGYKLRGNWDMCGTKAQTGGSGPDDCANKCSTYSAWTCTGFGWRASDQTCHLYQDSSGCGDVTSLDWYTKYSACGHNCASCSGDNCSTCKGKFFLYSDGDGLGTCLGACPPGYYEKGDGDKGRICAECDGNSRRRRAKKCTHCDDGFISSHNSDDCQNLQDTCKADQCRPCLKCMQKVEPTLAKCAIRKDPNAQCVNPGQTWCYKAMSHLHLCQRFSVGCYIKLQCQSPCICPSWKDVHCGGKIGGSGETCSPSLLQQLEQASAQNDVEDAVAVLRHAGRNVTKQVPAAEIETSRLDEALASKPC